jgi:hypothetical protein
MPKPRGWYLKKLEEILKEIDGEYYQPISHEEWEKLYLQEWNVANETEENNNSSKSTKTE